MPAEESLERLVVDELSEAGVLSTSAGRLLVLCARRVESTGGAADAVRQYWAARAEALPGVPAPEPAATPNAEGGDDEPKRPVGSTAGTLTLVS